MSITIETIREKILDQAIRGELIEQDPNDEPVEILLEEIEEEKEKLVKAKKIRKQKPLQVIEDEEIPYEIPEGWTWLRLGELTLKLGAGKTPLGGAKNYIDEGGIPFIRSQNVYNFGLKTENIVHIPIEIHDSMENSSVCKKDILLNITGGSIGRSCLLPTDFKNANVNQHVAIIRLIRPELRFFIHLIITSPYFQEKIMQVQVGSSREGLSMDKLSKLLIPLPPIEEQKRVMEKVEALFSLCDKWEEEVNKQQNHLSVLREKVLEDAIKGLLVEQDESDEPAETLLKHIAEEKEQLIKKKMIKKSKPLPEIEDEEIPYELPKGWKWVRLGNLILNIRGGGTPSKANPDYWDGQIHWCSVKDMNDEMFLTTTRDKITPLGVEKSSTILVPKNNLIVATRMGLGKVKITEIETAINQDLKALFTSDKVVNEYLYYSLKQLEFEGKGSTVKGITQNELINSYIPLPPLNEQKRIIKKIESLFSYIDQLEAQIVLPK